MSIQDSLQPSHTCPQLRVLNLLGAGSLWWPEKQMLIFLQPVPAFILSGMSSSALAHLPWGVHFMPDRLGDQGNICD